MKIIEKKVKNERVTEFKFENGTWVCICAGYEDGSGSWEHQSDEDDDETYYEGGLWFEGMELVDYDGIFELPEEVKLAIKDLGYKIEDLPQYQFGQIMRQKPQATMLHYYALDNGFYFMGNARPVNRYFCYFNINPPELLPEQQAVIEKREVDFVVALEKTLPKKIL